MDLKKSSMSENKEYIEFLSKLANLLADKIHPSNSATEIAKLFKTSLGLINFDIVIWDNNNMLLKDFICNWSLFDDEEQIKSANYIFSSLSMKNENRFYFNDKTYNCMLSENDMIEIYSNIEEENIIYYPLISNNEVFGLIKAVVSDETVITREFFNVINVSSKLLSGAINNHTLNEQMEISLNFYRAMKDIAKIIETQYELSYIIPIIGEMIDRFISSHLIYIFIYKEDEFNLVWPNACKDKNVYDLLKRVNIDTDYIVSENQRIGVFPISNGEELLGAVVAYSNIDKLMQKDIDYLLQLTRQSGMTIQRANVYAEVLKHATMDALTGLNNRRQFEIRLNQETANSKRNNIPLCSMMIDVDYFKKVNDTYGHYAGDCVLKNVSNIIKKEIREYDIACRYGGEEFFIILPQTGINEASLVAQRLRKVIEDANIDITEAGISGLDHIKVTVSIGVCKYDESMTSSEFVNKADKALYEAKTTGRNRVIVG